MITALEAKIMKEGEAEEKAYKEFFEWCDDAAKNVESLIKGVSVVIDAAAFSVADKKKLLGLIQNMQGDENDDEELGAPAPDTYKSHSGGIVDTLTSMKDDAEGELSEARKAEANAQHNYDMLKQGLTDEIAAAEHEKKEQEDIKNEAAELQATSEGELVITEKDLADAQAALQNISTDCMEKASDHTVSTQGRADELKALATAKKIIQESTSGAEGQSYSFLQVSATSRLQTATDLRNFEVVNVLKRLAQQQHSTALSQLASRVATTIRYGQASGDDPFAKVKGLIEEMIAKLMKEAEAEASHKAYCDEEMSKTKAKKDELNADIKKLTSKIDS